MRRFLCGLGLLLLAALPALAQTPEQQAELVLVNQFRASQGVGPLAFDARLMQSAQEYAEVLAAGAPFSHTGPDGRDPFQRMADAGFPGSYMGENIARGFPDVPSVMVAWENSPGHRRNLLDPLFTHIGIGIAGSGALTSWVQDFGRGGTTMAPAAPPSPPALPAPVPVIWHPPVPPIHRLPLARPFLYLPR